MRLGFVVYGDLDARSGGYRYDRRLVERFEEAGDDVDVISLPDRGYVRSLLHNLSPSIRRRLRGRYDVLVEDELCHPSLLRANRGRDVPVVSIVHHLRCCEAGPSTVPRLLERRYLAGVDAAICVSGATRRAVTALRDRPAAVVPPGRDHLTADVTADGIRERATMEPLRIVFLGSLVPRKGVHTLLEGLSRVRDDAWRLDVIGDPSVEPEYADRVQRLAGELSLAGAVTFPGRLSDRAVANRLGEGHVLAVPSTYEGFGLAYLEGMAFGVPAIATTAGGADELVTDGETGFLIPPGTPAALADAVEALMADRDRLARMGIAARTRYLSHPTWAETADRARSFLRGIAASRADGARYGGGG